MKDEKKRGPGGSLPKLDGGKRRNVYLDEETKAKAMKIGGGNISEGIRIAIAGHADATGRAREGVMYRKDGKFLSYSESYGHTGTRRRVSWVDDAGSATVVFAPLPHQVREEIEGAEVLRVEQTRFVRFLADNATA